MLDLLACQFFNGRTGGRAGLIVTWLLNIVNLPLVFFVLWFFFKLFIVLSNLSLQLIRDFLK